MNAFILRHKIEIMGAAKIISGDGIYPVFQVRATGKLVAHLGFQS
jgi:hypothetical protein